MVTRFDPPEHFDNILGVLDKYPNKMYLFINSEDREETRGQHTNVGVTSGDLILTVDDNLEDAAEYDKILADLRSDGIIPCSLCGFDRDGVIYGDG